MTTPLLMTKLHIPPVRPDLVPRPRLIERLNEGLHRRLTLISAPAGFGKTTLLSEWVAGCGQPTAWLSLDEGDNDPTRFWAYFIAALQTIHEDVGEAARAALQSRGFANANTPPRVEVLLTGLISEVTAADPDPFSLVLDDFQLITAPQVNDALASLLDNLPPQMHLVLSSRADPPWPLARLRVCGELTELRTDDLRFTSTEAAAFLNDVMGLGLSAGDIAALDARTEGWIAGLQMAALSMQGRQDVTRFIKAFSGSHRFILDYLVEEVLDRQPSDIQEFLLKTSILERMTAPVCDAVTDRNDSQAILPRLDQANLFIVPLDDERRWYRYHHLFADLLRSRLKQTQPGLETALHSRASEWFERDGAIAEAVGYALAGGDVERVARLVAGNILALMEHGELMTLGRRMDALPREAVRSQPWLGVACAWVLAFSSQLDAVEPLLEDIERTTAELDQSADAGRIAGYVAAVRAQVASVRGQVEQAKGLAREALEHLPPDDLMTRSWASVALALNHYRSDDWAAADRALAEALATSRATGDSHIAVLTLCTLAVVQRERGQLHSAADTSREALQLARTYANRVGRPLPVSGYAHICLATVLREWNDLEAAMNHAEKGMALCEQWGEPELLSGAYMHLARVLDAVGDTDGAFDAIQKGKQAASNLSPWYAARLALLEALLRLRQGDLAAASHWDATQHDEPSGHFDISESWSAWLTRVRLCLCQDHPDEALALLTRLLEETEAAEAGLYLVASLALQALALRAKGEHDAALEAIKSTLTLAEPEGYVRTFIDEGEPMGELLRKAAARGIAVGYVGRLLAALEKDTEDKRQLGKTHPASMVEPPSERELEVLRLLTTHLTSNDIAKALFISVNTVRTHIKSIYSKLDVHSREDAVQRAEKLDLL